MSIVLDFYARNGGVKRFKTRDDLEAFCKPMPDPRFDTGTAGLTEGHARRELYREMSKDWDVFVEVAVQHIHDAAPDNDLQAVLQSVIDTRLPLVPGSLLHQQILSLYNESYIDTARATLILATRTELSDDEYKTHYDRLRALSPLVASASYFEDVEARLHRINLEVRGDYEELVEQKDKLEKDASVIRESFDAIALRLQKVVDEAELRTVAHQNKLDDEWQNITDSFKENLRLNAATALWSDRAADHNKNSKGLSRLAMGAGVLTPVVTIAAGFCASHMSDFVLGVAQTEDRLHQMIFAAAATLLVLTLCLWFTRILVRLYMTQQHLYIDAETRAVLANTYVSLIAEGQAGIDDRKIVLATLFRPVNDGIIQDDALPFFSPAALASSALLSDKKS